MKRILILGFMIFILVPVPVGFAAGWILGQRQVNAPIGTVAPPETSQPTPYTTRPTVPETDASGSDIAGLPRYPGSVRTEYEREIRGGLVLIEAKFLTTAGLEEVRKFYREVFRSEGWSVADLDFSDDERNFFVVDGEVEAHVKIASRGERLVEIEIRLTRPQPGVGSEPQAPEGGPARSREAAPPAREGPPESVPPDHTPPVQAPPAQGPPESTPSRAPENPGRGP